MRRDRAADRGYDGHDAIREEAVGAADPVGQAKAGGGGFGRRPEGRDRAGQSQEAEAHKTRAAEQVAEGLGPEEFFPAFSEDVRYDIT
ncbi:MAG: hypothetical protein ACREJX_02590, partial [Polyangiaceae bacterium]